MAQQSQEAAQEGRAGRHADPPTRTRHRRPPSAALHGKERMTLHYCFSRQGAAALRNREAADRLDRRPTMSFRPAIGH
jgi:hypothetical protein